MFQKKFVAESMDKLLIHVGVSDGILFMFLLYLKLVGEAMDASQRKFELVNKHVSNQF